MKIHRQHLIVFGVMMLSCTFLRAASLPNYNYPLKPGTDFADSFKKISDSWETNEVATNGPIHIVLGGGLYWLDHPLRFISDNKKNRGAPVIIEAAHGEHPVLSGGLRISGWKNPGFKISGLPVGAAGHVWMANAPVKDGRIVPFRQLWVNGMKAIRARQPDDERMERLLAWDKRRQTATISKDALKGITTAGQLEMVVDQVWEIAVLRVKTITLGASNAVITFHQPESNIEFLHPWPPVIVKTNYQAPFYLVNAIEFLDAPGEWYEDIKAGKIYYWPRPGEDMTRAEIIAPILTSLVQIEGTPDNPVSRIQFKGITFAHTTWLRPSEQGHVPLQAGMYLLDAKKLSPPGTPYHRGLDNLAWIGRPPAAVTIKNASHISFEDCTFEHLASAGLDFISGTTSNLVEGCTFRDIGGNGLQLGEFSQTNVETHIPWIPTDKREVCQNEIIRNNVFTDCGSEDWGCVGICVGYAGNINISHNDVFDLPYSGISVGWGWSKMTNAMRDNLIYANRIHHIGQRLGDLGGVYTLSSQPGTVVAENYISDITPSSLVPDPEHWFYLYLDEGSSFITVRDNWCPSQKFLKNANGPGNVWTNNGPQVSAEIKAGAGLEPKYRNLLK